jgi:hypothetical protein
LLSGHYHSFVEGNTHRLYLRHHIRRNKFFAHFFDERKKRRPFADSNFKPSSYDSDGKKHRLLTPHGREETQDRSGPHGRAPYHHDCGRRLAYSVFLDCETIFDELISALVLQLFSLRSAGALAGSSRRGDCLM